MSTHSWPICADSQVFRSDDYGSPDDNERTQEIERAVSRSADGSRREVTHILVADDDPALRAVLTTFLEEQGFSVAAAPDGAAALESIRRQRPALILLDLYMPRVDGWAVARQLDAEGIRVPIVVMTAASSARQQARELGAVSYVAKPVNLPALVSQLDRLCA